MRQSWISPNVCSGLVVLAVSAMSVALLWAGAFFLIVLLSH